MKEVLLVFVGGGLGSLCRYFITKAYGSLQVGFPFATLTSNFLSCVFFGIILFLATNKLTDNPYLKVLFLTGFCGGFSTFSAFTFETVQLFKTGSGLLALSNIFLNIFLSITGLYLGTVLARIL